MRSRSAGAPVIALLAALVPGRAGPQGLAYPPARRDTVVDVYHGTPVADPYRWLERPDDPATAAWVAAERGLAERYLAGLPGRQAIRRRLGELRGYNRTEVPWREAGRLFFLATTGLGPQPVLYAVSAPEDSPVVVLDPGRLSPDGSISVHDFAVSPDGRWLTYTLSPGGGGEGRTRVRELGTGRDLADEVRGVLGTPCWTFDGAGFFYVRPPEPRPGDPPGGARIEKRLLYHLLGRPQAEDRLLHEWTDNYRWVYCMLSDDGRRAIVVAERGATQSMLVMDLDDPATPDLAAPLVPLLAEPEAGWTPMGTVGDTLFLVTDLDAPRGRVVAVDLGAGEGARAWTVIPESPQVIETATVAGHHLAVNYLVDVASRLRLFDLDGRPAGEVALPGIGAVGWPLNGRASAPELLYSFASFLAPETAYRYDPATGASTAFRPPRTAFDPTGFETKQLFYSSRDGTRVPMFVTARRDLRLDGTHPVLLTVYGGFGTVSGPRYRPDIALWLELGGVHAVANIRGGGEYGEAWHRAGIRENKQNGLDDVIAAAEHLVSAGYTDPGRIALSGHSNGGMIVAAVLDQRPDLFGVALPDAGPYDMLRFPRFTIGAGWIPEYGSPDEPDGFAYLRAYSPLHNVRPDTCYPATLLLAADRDDTVVPSHSFKLTAALQAAQSCPRPILLRIASAASHGYAAEATTLDELTDLWAFTAVQLGVPVPDRP